MDTRAAPNEHGGPSWDWSGTGLGLAWDWSGTGLGLGWFRIQDPHRPQTSGPNAALTVWGRAVTCQREEMTLAQSCFPILLGGAHCSCGASCLTCHSGILNRT